MSSTTLLPQVYSKYKTEVFFETGSYKGDAISLVLDHGTNKVISIEIIQQYYDECVKRFETQIKNGVVDLHLGNSLEKMKELVPTLNQKTTFWLDAHMDLGHIHPDVSTHSPIMEELEVIKSFSNRNDHTIMIDDMRMFRGKLGWANTKPFSSDDIEAKIREINPNYKIVYEANGVQDGDVLVAFID